MMLDLNRCGEFDRYFMIHTTQTAEYAGRISQLLEREEIHFNTIDENDFKNSIGKLDEGAEASVMIGPATKHLAIRLWSELIQRFHRFPRILVDHRKKTSQGRSILPEKVHRLSEPAHLCKLISLVNTEDACFLYGIAMEEFDSVEELYWDENHAIFTLQFPQPTGADAMRKSDARAWADEVTSTAASWQDRVGRHAIRIGHDPLPNDTNWSVIRERLSQADFRGGNL